MTTRAAWVPRRGRRAHRGWLRVVALLPLAAWAVSALGCAAIVLPLEEIDPAPIAVLHWDDEDSRRRKELLEQARMPPGVGMLGASGVATPDTLGQFLGIQREGALQLLAQLSRFPGRLSLVDPRTGSLTEVPAAWPGSRPLAWSADHSELLFASDQQSGTWQLFVYDTESGNVRRITRTDEDHFTGDVSRDGRYLYTGLERRGRQMTAHVYVTGPRGVDPVPVMEGGFSEAHFMPDGKAMLLVRADVRSSRPNAPPLVTVHPLDDPAGDERLLARGRQVAMSANGEWIVYSGARPGGWRLVRVRPDGAGRSQVGRGARDEVMPAVSPDGRHVAYVTEEGEFDRLFVRRIDGSGDRVLLDDGSVAWPVW